MGKQSVCDTCAFIHLEIDTYITVPVKKLSQQKIKITKLLAGALHMYHLIKIFKMVFKKPSKSMETNIFIKIDVFPVNTCLRYGKSGLCVIHVLSSYLY